ncbi:hypothetical protein AGDE_05417 [Angomonas deanei]|nr:hypothetical protein AGDE_05417 [Angomonas deanei]|eukprot:EPY38512.1 hypothetical protein AGDE_05417 [Angomonas deanei]
MDGWDEQVESLKDGGIVQYDFRTEENKTKKLPSDFSLVQWNIERGIKLEEILDTLCILMKSADILIVQEIDLFCRRSAYKNVLFEIAKATQTHAVFFCEFEELDSDLRKEEHAVGPLSAPADSSDVQRPPRHFHGNAIFSKCVPLRAPTVIFHRVQPVNWNVGGSVYREPRRGRRGALRVTVFSCDRSDSRTPPLVLYNCHLEVFCGGLDRVRQLGDCILDAHELTMDYTRTWKGKSAALLRPAYIIAGDLNTMAHGIVRFSNRYGTDRLKLLSMGESEACWLQRKFLNAGMLYNVKGCCPLSYRFPFYVLSNVYELLLNNSLVWTLLYGFSFQAIWKLKAAVTELCFYDTGDKYQSVTLNNAQYNGLVQGKLDWVLLSNLTTVSHTLPHDQADVLAALRASQSMTEAPKIERDGYVLFNDTYRDSDHKGIWIKVHQNTEPGPPSSCYPPYGALYSHSITPALCLLGTRCCLAAAAAFAVYKYLVK